MLHKSIQRQLRQQRAERGQRSSPRQLMVLFLMMIIIGSWALDANHVSLVPARTHERFAAIIDAETRSWPIARLPSVDAIVAHNPIDQSPITFGAVILLGLVCSIALLTLGFTGPKQH